MQEYFHFIYVITPLEYFLHAIDFNDGGSESSTANLPFHTHKLCNETTWLRVTTWTGHSWSDGSPKKCLRGSLIERRQIRIARCIKRRDKGYGRLTPRQLFANYKEKPLLRKGLLAYLGNNYPITFPRFPRYFKRTFLAKFSFLLLREGVENSATSTLELELWFW